VAHDLTVQQYNVLRILRGAGPSGLPTLEIGERLIQPTPGITRLIDRLEKKGLVERERLASDRRCVLCTLTPAGLELVNGLDDLVDRRDEEALQGLDAAQTEELIALLDLVRAGLPR
jgi:DNA-binding MarR family transcriptional regulator